MQNSGFVYMTSTLSILSLQRWQCPADVDLFAMGPEARTKEWQQRVRDIQGAIIIVGIIQMFLGYSGEYNAVLFSRISIENRRTIEIVLYR